MDFEKKFSYFDWKNELKETFDWFEHLYENTWISWEELIAEFEEEYLGINSEFQEDERMATCIILPLTQFEIHNNALTPELLEVFESYYDAYTEDLLEDLFKPSEYVVVRADFIQCNSYKNKEYPKNDRRMYKYKLSRKATQKKSIQKTFSEIPLNTHYCSLKKEFFERCNQHLQRQKSLQEFKNKSHRNENVLARVSEDVLNFYNCKISENGMERLALTISACLYELSHKIITRATLQPIVWMVESFENERYSRLLKKQDYIAIRKDIDEIRRSLTLLTNVSTLEELYKKMCGFNQTEEIKFIEFK